MSRHRSAAIIGGAIAGTIAGSCLLGIDNTRSRVDDLTQPVRNMMRRHDEITARDRRRYYQDDDNAYDANEGSDDGGNENGDENDDAESRTNASTNATSTSAFSPAASPRTTTTTTAVGTNSEAETRQATNRSRKKAIIATAGIVAGVGLCAVALAGLIAEKRRDTVRDDQLRGRNQGDERDARASIDPNYHLRRNPTSSNVPVEREYRVIPPAFSPSERRASHSPPFSSSRLPRASAHVADANVDDNRRFDSIVPSSGIRLRPVLLPEEPEPLLRTHRLGSRLHDSGNSSGRIRVSQVDRHPWLSIFERPSVAVATTTAATATETPPSPPREFEAPILAGSSDDTCPLTLEPLAKQSVVALACGHKFDARALDKQLRMFNQRCAMCRAEVSYEDIERVSIRASEAARVLGSLDDGDA